MSQLPWTEAHWARVQAAVTEEFTKSSVAGAALPCYGPLEGGVESVPGQFLVEDDNKLRINDHDSVRLSTVNVYVEFNGQQVNDPNLSTVLYAIRRAANRLARIEDDIVFNGYSSEEGNPVRLPNPLYFSKEWVRPITDRGSSELYKGVDVSNGTRKIGLLSAGYDFADNARAPSSRGVTVVHSDLTPDQDRLARARAVMSEFKGKVAGLNALSAKYWPSADADLRDVDKKGLIAATNAIKDAIAKYLEAIEKLKGELVQASDSRFGWPSLKRKVEDKVDGSIRVIKRFVEQATALSPNENDAEKAIQSILRDALGALDEVAGETRNCLSDIEELFKSIGGYSEDSYLRSKSAGLKYGENLVTSVAEAISVLEGSGYPGPFTCLFSPWMFDEAHRPHGNSLVLPADRIAPMLGGPLLRAGLMVDGFGVVVATSEESIDIVVATPPKVQFIQMTTEAKYRFRVYERFALRIKDPRAAQLLILAR